MDKLYIDIETFSGASLKEVGMYKYVDDPDFQILLFGYSLNGRNVNVVDLAQGEVLPPWLVSALRNEQYIKIAHNAEFEWCCLSKIFGSLPIEQWRCTMIHSLYCGYPAKLEAAGQALKLPEDHQKLSSGKALIRYFCMPCKPTKANGGRKRNLPRHDRSRWELFKHYNAGDVITEMAISRRLSSFPVPYDVERQWQTNVRINSYGVAVDMDLVRGALELGETCQDALIAEARQLTGLDNPNSVPQLTGWLGAEGVELPNLRKETVSQLLDGYISNGRARRALELRQEMSKTSIKKYNAIERAVCADGRVRGLLQFYGANRTGRWAGRLIQVQNLPRTHIDALPLARDIVKQRQGLKLSILYGSLADTLSQLIRTAFIASPGCALIDTDFSSIEARVISWLADEHWRLDVFKTHGKIYEASASQMFGVPLERIKKGNPEYDLRQRGKVAELALGYQGGTGALIEMGAIKMGLSENELPEIVARWRSANKRICALWDRMNKAAISVIQTGSPADIGKGVVLAREIDLNSSLDFLTMALPSGRKLYYAHPEIGENKWGGSEVVYWGMNQDTKKWSRNGTYGGKLVENCVQAIARDCLAEAIERLNYSILFHVHDEIVIDCYLEDPECFSDTEYILEDINNVLSAPMPWAPDLPLGADGWAGDFYRKE